MNLQTRLTRSAHDKVIGGVCGGLAHYFGIDPVIVRLIFVALVFAGGMSILLYPILWLIMPVDATVYPGFATGLQEMQQVGQHVAGQVSDGAQALRARVEAAFASNRQPRFDPQTGQPLVHAARNSRLLGVVLVGVGILVLSSFIPGGSGIAVALMLLGGGYYLLRQTS